MQPERGTGGEAPRPLGVILAQPKLIVAILTAMTCYALMNFAMTATPIAMIACNHSIGSAALAIQWHVLAMFAPSFFTGSLIQRFGRERIAVIGLALLIGAAAVALSGIDLWHFNVSLVLLGIGWNFGFIAATTMVTDCHRPEERGKVQAVSEFATFGAVAAASFASGMILHELGWQAVAWTIVPFAAAAGLLVLVLMLTQARRAGAA
jgi:MFS family permease